MQQCLVNARLRHVRNSFPEDSSLGMQHRNGPDQRQLTQSNNLYLFSRHRMRAMRFSNDSNNQRCCKFRSALSSSLSASESSICCCAANKSKSSCCKATTKCSLVQIAADSSCSLNSPLQQLQQLESEIQQIRAASQELFFFSKK